MARRDGIAPGILVCGIALLASAPLSRAQDAPAANPAAPDLSTFYRFRESYTTGEQSALGGAIGPYRVGLKQTIKTTTDQPSGAPLSDEVTIHAIYQERPADVSQDDPRKVRSVIRRYETVKITPDRNAKPSGPQPFLGLSLWYHLRPGEPAEILVLTPDRTLTEDEYGFTLRQVFMPSLTYVLPEIPKRVGETWPLSAASVTAMLPDAVAGELTSKFVGLRRVTDPEQRKAIFDITGKVDDFRYGETAVHAEIQFLFKMPRNSSASAVAPGASQKSQAIDALGEITRLSMAQEFSMGQTSPTDRLKQSTRSELVLERRTTDPGPLLAIPNPLPQATVANSWLTYIDPMGKFQIQFPQEFSLTLSEPNRVDFERESRGIVDRVEVDMLPKDKLELGALQKRAVAYWDSQKMDVTMGETGPLPDADWPNMKVSRISMSLTPTEAAPGEARSYYDVYAVLTGKSSGFVVKTQTSQEPMLPFREQVEKIIKTIQLDVAMPARRRQTNPPRQRPADPSRGAGAGAVKGR
jgi:hypothetical protein